MYIKGGIDELPLTLFAFGFDDSSNRTKCVLVEMKTVKCRGMVLGMAVMTLAALVSAQITFSRDWTGGKRAAPQVGLDCGQFARLCRHFVHELKAAMTSEISASDKRRRIDEPPIYDEE